MKILDKENIQKADAYTIENEPIASVNLMERASRAFTGKFTEYFPKDRKVMAFCGKGNNGGDGLAISRMLLMAGYRVETYVVNYTEKASGDFQINRERLMRMHRALVKDIRNEKETPEIDPKDIIIEALWGSGLSRPVKGFATSVIEKLNNSGAIIVTVDIPSGIFCDSYNKDPVKVRAAYTFTFQNPKYSFMMPESGPFTGNFEVLDIGLSREFIQSVPTRNYYLTGEEVLPLVMPRQKFGHKGDFGHALLITGSYGKMGAGVIASEACLRAGIGLVSAYIPKCGYYIFQTALPEAMVMADKNETHITRKPEFEKATVIGAGPGLGTAKETANMLEEVLEESNIPVVLDADALNILAQNTGLQKKLGKNMILTPHPGEFDRLAGKSPDFYERIEKLRAFCKEHRCIILLKGAHTAIASPEGDVYFNSTGNPGMATGGSGDVLTGILTALAGQGYSPLESAMLGVYLHGKAGDLAAAQTGETGLIATDIIGHIPEALVALRK